MPPLLTYDPIDQLKPVAAAIWVADGGIIRFACLGLQFPFTTRMILAQLADGTLSVHSPTALTPDLRRQIDAIGPVRYLIAPNTLHYAFLTEWRYAYPAALAYGVPSVAERARRCGAALHLDGMLADTPEPGLGGRNRTAPDPRFAAR